MIGKLKGIMDSYGEDYVILDVGGVGYQVQCPARTLQSLPAPGEPATLSTHELTNAIALQDKAMIARAPGVGPKVAQRIVSELKDKAPAFAPADPVLAKLQADLSAAKPTAASDAVSALVNLGYGQTQAGAAVSAAMRKAGEDAPTERLIRLALKELALV
jgi:Holliday junction DNA helicase RuvA